MIKNNESVKRYQKIEKILNENEDLNSMINKLKTIQKQLINAKEIQKQKSIEHFEQLYNKLFEEIQCYPLMSDYLALQGEINDMIQQVTQVIEDGVNKELKAKL